MSLRFLLDQNIPIALTAFLRSRRPSWIVEHVYDVGLGGASDQAIFAWAQQVAAIVVTYDEDFADARMYPIGSHAGVIRLRVWPKTYEETKSAFDRLLRSMMNGISPAAS